MRLRRASSSLDELMGRSPRFAYRKIGKANKNNNNDDYDGIANQDLEEINVTDVRIGDLLVVRPGDSYSCRWNNNLRTSTN